MKNEQNIQDDRAGASDHPQHRAGKEEGVRSPGPDELGFGENSIFDGAGNEVVVVTTANEDGQLKQGTGPTREAAMKDAKKMKDKPIGGGFWSDPHAK